ncbi:double-strand break repair helicase AddA [Zhengella mangrovi]|uniref:DNA 3'-5' helicase n=1 Tax=Zhengella mangrovi TaxID=1982044 RepID=A0A2G1QTZ1_9HYPH|nr:double-strand break repair helicase AddA [Zhengella mangrovi]PHP68955.1 double-strand break repair helicase AddA [Zhengella mangrovi]
MSGKLTIPPEVIASQTRAANPDISAWVSANAGSGKTHVLASRVIRLLLAGADPQKILCLTYTKAAAANMSNRIFRTLGEWAMADDAQLAAAMRDLTGEPPTGTQMRDARRLFARALETPGGLKIQTIHAFCEAILHQFPLEANIAGHFEMLDGRMEAALVGEARRRLLSGAAKDDAGLGAAFGTVLTTAGETGLDTLMQDIVARRDELTVWLEHADEGDACRGDLKQSFGLDPADSADTIAAAILPDAWFTQERFRALATEGADKDAKAPRDLGEKGFHALQGATSEDRLRGLIPLFTRVEKGAVIARSSRGYPGSKLAALFPDMQAEFERFAAVLAEAADRLSTLDMVENTAAALTIADRLIARYEFLKRSRGFLDFNDLIRRTANLLSRQDASAWVHYKLDRGIDHILVDEAQDTSPVQWDVIKGLASEFFAGQGARDGATRTIFAVGDEKQSIYSFQGAEPDAFDATLNHFRTLTAAAGQPLEPVKLTYSFRSTPDVLRAVDTVFAAEAVRKGLTRYGDVLEHKAVRDGHPGHVEVWPSLATEKSDEEEDWTKGIDHATAPAVELANRIAATLQSWLAAGEILPGQGRAITAGDVLVLVRKRDRFIHALSRALKNLGIPVAGADRLSLPAHIAVKDMIAIGRFVMQPEDDLSLAAVLKSPVFGLDDSDLMRLGLERPASRSLWRCLRDAAAQDPRYQAAETLLSAWRAEAGFRKPADFYAGLLARDGVRRRMVARLGAEADEILDEFLAFALAQERTGVCDMESLLYTLETAGPEVKREMDQSRSELRIMTAHAAKGLEAPVVFLVDSGSAPVVTQNRSALTPFKPQGDGIKRFVWRAGALKNRALAAIDAENDARAEDEYRRLLYVGMTRAEDRLVVCGYHGKTGQKDGTWQRLAHEGLVGSPHVSQQIHGVTGETILVYRETDGPGRPVRAPDTTPAAASAPPLPFDPAARPVAAETLPRPLSPSGAAVLIEPEPGDTPPAASPVLEAPDAPPLAIRRGIAVHTLFQMLPDVTPDRRAETARAWLERTAADWPGGETERALASVLAILDDTAFADAFGPGSRAEVPISGQVEIAGRRHPVSGIIDRLHVSETGVLALDFKTNRPPPASLQQVPRAYVVQMALYQALLGQLWPDRPVTCALLFTETARLITLPSDAMAEALAALRVHGRPA